MQTIPAAAQGIFRSQRGGHRARRDFVIRGVPHYSAVSKRETNDFLLIIACANLTVESILSVHQGKAYQKKMMCPIQTDLPLPEYC